ncbi:peptidase [Roseiconus lacunae]|uniref:Peptidase n=1 Tax=Roseiconus lacunae TaxID=2605694 RepID=A0ABT7PD79_9BACT|nr:peptidase [Roseiconus lacunae]MDM4014432.1 peptidase [Roseiconus lacunae]
MSPSINRRRFLATTAAITAPAIITSKRTQAQDVIGSGDYQFQFQHGWPQLPDQFRWQTTHNVTVAPDNRLFVIHEGKSDLKDHPSIFVFDEDGRFIKAFGQQFQGGGHGLDIRVESGTPYLYVSGYQHLKTICKLTLDGEVVWQRFAPMESGKYAEGEASNPEGVWGRDRFMPTNFAFLDDGDFLVADGYGAYVVHRYDADGQWKGFFGGAGKGDGTFNLPHGIWIDKRNEAAPTIVVADRAHHTLQLFDMEQNYLRTIDGFGLPANINTHGDLMLVPELVARVSLLDQDYKTVVTLGDDRDRVSADKKRTIRSTPDKWQPGKFVHPHDACFDNNGDLFVAEWVATGRITKLTRV